MLAKSNTQTQKENYAYLLNQLGIKKFDDWNKLPFGKAILICDLTDCILMNTPFINQQSKAEKLCGHWKKGRYAWKLENVQPLIPLNIKGKQRLWNVNLQQFELIHNVTVS